MENDEFNDRIVKKVRSRIVMSNLESEENMRLSRKIKVLSLVAVVFSVLTGGFVTVNAVTDGELVNKVIDTVNVIFIKEGKEEKVEGHSYKDSNNNEIVRYNVEENGTYHEVEVNKTVLDEKEFKFSNVIEEDEVTIIIDKVE